MVPLLADMSNPVRIWSIQREHLDEAEFLFETWASCIDAPKYTLAKLRDGAEARLLAHVDGLLIGGQRTLDELLIPVLAAPDDDEFRTAAAAFTILTGASLDACAHVLHALAASEARSGLDGLVRALGLSQRSGLVPWLARELDQVSGPALVGRLRALEMHRVEAGAWIGAWLAVDDPEVRRVAARLGRHSAAPEALHALAQASNDPDPTVRWAAIESALIRELPGAWELVRTEALALREPALAWAGMLGDHGVHERLLAALDAPTPKLLWTAGLSGRPAAVDRSMALLDHPELARAAGELVCTITGLSRHDDRYWLDNGIIKDDPDEALPPLEDDDLDARLVPPSEAALRLPKPETVRAWWAGQRERFEAARRYASGRVLDGPQLQRELIAGPTRLRHARALELAARSGGLAQIESRALTGVQLAQINALGERFAGLDCQRGHPLARA